MLINSPNISGSLTVTGNSVITGSLTVLGGINATITGSATTASYVEYSNVANKPTLVSGSEQITYSGLSGIPSGIVSSSTQITGYNIFATTGSNQFDGSQAITGSLTVTGQVVAQTLNVQQVTSSIVFSSGSNIFGNSLANTQQFTGSLQVTGSTHYLLGNMGIGTTSPDVFSRGDERNVGISVPGASDNLALALNAGGSAGRGAQIYMGQGGTRHLTISSNATETRVGTTTNTPLILTTNDTTRLTIASTGAATFSSTAQDSFTINTTNTDGPVIRIQNSGTNVGLFGNAEGVTNGGTTNFAIRSTNNLIFSTGGANPRMTILSGGNVGVGTTNPSWLFEINKDTNSASFGQYPAISVNNPNASGYSAYYFFSGTINKGGIEYYNGDNSFLFYANNFERMRITSSGALAIGTTDIPTLSTPSGGQLIVMPNAVIVSGFIALGEPYTQNIQIDIVYNNWGGNNVIGLVDMIITLREYANTSGTAFGKVFAVNPGAGATFSSFNTTDVTTSQCTVTASSGGNYTLRITIDPSNVTDRGSFYLTIPNAGGTGSTISSITVSYV
jgi:hypothetical protein